MNAKQKLQGYGFKIRESKEGGVNSTYANSNTLKVYLRLDREFEGQDYLTLSKTAAEELNKLETPEERLAFVATLEVAQGLTEDNEVLWGLQMPESTTILAEGSF